MKDAKMKETDLKSSDETTKTEDELLNEAHRAAEERMAEEKERLKHGLLHYFRAGGFQRSWSKGGDRVCRLFAQLSLRYDLRQGYGIPHFDGNAKEGADAGGKGFDPKLAQGRKRTGHCYCNYIRSASVYNGLKNKKYRVL